MALELETITFLKFIAVGILLCIIFDIFRALRKIKKRKTAIIYIQDIIYFLIVGVILLISIIYLTSTTFRFYFVIAIVLGVVMYMSIVGNIVMKFYILIMRTFKSIFSFLMLPVEPYYMLSNKQIKKLEKNVANCCKKISNMINFYCSKLKKTSCLRKIKTKEGCINEKGSN